MGWHRCNLCGMSSPYHHRGCPGDNNSDKKKRAEETEEEIRNLRLENERLKNQKLKSAPTK